MLVLVLVLYKPWTFEDLEQQRVELNWDAACEWIATELDPSSADPIRRRQDASSYSDTVEPLDIVTPPASDVARAIIYGVPLPTDRPVTTIQTNPYVAKYRMHQIETLAHGLSSPMENRLGFSYYRRRASAGRLSNIELR